MPLRPALPISLYLRGRRAVVVGTGDGAGERARRLRDAGAQVELIAGSDYRAEALRSAFVVLAHTGDGDLDRRIAADARSCGALAYAHDRPEDSDFAMPALVRRGPLQIAISTSGVAPSLARRLREELDRIVTASGEAVDQLLADLRAARAALPPGRRSELYLRLATRLSIRGVLHIDAPGPPE